MGRQDVLTGLWGNTRDGVLIEHGHKSWYTDWTQAGEICADWTWV